ncbi:restriction endonuclease subunit S [Serpentinicella alkaliphila]|uniref:Type I restriction enzyme S subunit n=1 Tax=Serpentinicella alkaliphila TaxID=1734049 RepID=A0A4R2TL31_9FIRM|nr:restriction endonuclease subunit S [Serpentinicella alkaliphila]QUH25543.1 restriction endonuclease subunit S [Serpentinicella alkaliphila]TCQ01895.1 type I restriction enzyme S subunit [Serpentinicella alkaliphila]
MIKSNFMEKLLDGVEIEWKAIWEVTTWDKRFNAVSREKQSRVINYSYLLAAELFKLEQEEGDVFLLSTGERIGWTTEELAGDYIREGEVVTIPWGKSRPLKDVLKYYKGRFVTADNRIATSSNTDILLNKFLYYWLLNQSVIIDGFYRGSGIQHPNMASVLDMEIPIPPLKVQEEIVRILDAFTELTAELTARKKQYTYYRDKLLSFEEGEVEWKALGEVGELVRGNGLPKTDFTEIGVPAIHYGQIYTYYGTFTTETKSFVSYETAKKLKKVDTGDVVITNTSENLEDVGKAVVYLGKVQAVTGGHATIFKPSNQILVKYFAYFTQTEMFASQKRKYAKGTKVIDVSATDMSKIIIPIPTLTEQERIISILDKFDALTSSITEGLPREIELRQKQYEYYRNMLLSFPNQEV